AVMDAYTAAINAHDVEAALSYVADDAVYDRSVGAFNGKEEVRGFIQGIIDRNVHVELIGERTVDGERVTWQSRVMLDDPANPGGPQIEVRNNSESIVRDGKIVMHTARPAQ
ncbi:MAG TPA: nuclear transport factor 2 family protein, partial [Anaerolineae bacterium]